MPFSKRIKVLSEQSSELQRLFYDYDHLWYKIEKGHIIEDEINDQLRDLRKKKNLIDDRFVKQAQAPTDNKMIQKAMMSVEQYYS